MVRKFRNKEKYTSLSDDQELMSTSKRDKSKRKKDNKSSQSKRPPHKSCCDDENFRRMLEADGNKSIVEMASDGNCLFRSLSDQLYWDYGKCHEEIRSDICDFLASHEADFKMFLVLDEEDEDAADFESYISNMRECGEWGGNLELVAAARLYQRKIKVFSTNMAYTIEHGASKCLGSELMVSYHDNDHYNSVRDARVKGPPPPPVKSIGSNFFCPQSKCAVSPISKDTISIQTKPIGLEQGRKTNKQRAEGFVKRGICSCGSGKPARKCCLRKNGKGNSPIKSKVDVEQEAELENGFRVLKI